MKKIMMIAAMMATAIFAQAQNELGELTIKPMAGLAISNITKMGGDATKNLCAGIEGELGLENNFCISAGVIYAVQGTKAGHVEMYNSAGILTEGDFKIKNQYVNVPILANYYVLPGLAIKAGIQPSFLVKTTFEAKAAKESGEAETDMEFNKFDFSIPVGISYELGGFVLDARYNWGLTKVLKDSEDSSRNSVFMITLGYKFDFEDAIF